MAAKIIFLTAILFGFSGFYAQQFFYNTYGGNGYDTGSDVIQMEDSSYYVVGSSSSLNDGPSQVSLLHVDKFGNFLASYFYGGVNSDIGVRVLHQEGEGFWLAGYSNSFSDNADFDFYLIKLNENYEVEWQNTYGTSDWERLRDAILLPDGGVLLVGEVEGLNTQGKDAYLVRTDAGGEIVYEQTYAGAQDDIIYSCTMFDETTYLIGGVFGNTDANAWLAKFDLNGNVIWSRNDYFTDRFSVIKQVIVTDTYIYFYGNWTPLPYLPNNQRRFQATCHLNNSVFNIRYENGVGDEHASFCHFASNLLFSVHQVDNVDAVGENGPIGLVFTFDNAGYWAFFSHQIHGIKVKPERIIKTLDEAVIIVGTIRDTLFTSGGGDAFLLKIDASVGSLEVINNQPIVSLDNFEDVGFSFYPNPSHGSITIELPAEINAERYTILDVQGRVVQSGLFSPNIQMHQLAVGTYVLQLNTNAGLKSMRILKQ